MIVVVDAAIRTAPVVKLELAVFIEACNRQARSCIPQRGVDDANVDARGCSCYDIDWRLGASGVAIDGKICDNGLSDLAMNENVVGLCGGCEMDRTEEGKEEGGKDGWTHNEGRYTISKIGFDVMEILR